MIYNIYMRMYNIITHQYYYNNIMSILLFYYYYYYIVYTAIIIMDLLLYNCTCIIIITIIIINSKFTKSTEMAECIMVSSRFEVKLAQNIKIIITS